jgi:cytochrome c nitrite reductase small subunit
MTGKANTALGLLAIPLGMLVGLGVYTFGYARGASYLTNDPTSCNNCHVMRAQFEGWQRSSHSAAAVCNDCHTPAGLAPKYFTKMLNGFNHSLAFTSGRYPDEILITPRNHRVAGSACLKCHDDMTLAIRVPRHRDDGASCTTCHRNVGHEH